MSVFDFSKLDPRLAPIAQAVLSYSSITPKEIESIFQLSDIASVRVLEQLEELELAKLVSDKKWKPIKKNIKQFLKDRDTYQDDLADKFSPHISDPLLRRAIFTIKDYDLVFTSTLQRRLNIGYNKSAIMMDTLVKQGYLKSQGDGQPYKVIQKKK